jgi:1-acyl-sn-glycerol-3-phosphate acyltransferase
MEKIIYYQDELKDEFSTAQITPKHIDGNYIYVHKGLWKRFTHLFWYRIVATPIAFCFLKLKFRHKIINKSVLKQGRKTGYFLYGNHTHPQCDAFIPTMVNNPKDTYVIVHPDNVSMPVLGAITPSLGALPLPDDMEAGRHFMEAVTTRIREKNCVTIYPEAHIWPYYTKIRPFSDQSFAYPIKEKAPVYCFTNTYQKRKGSKTPRIVTYVDGPFYPKQDLKGKAQRKDLRDQVYHTMVKRSENNTVCMIRYEKKGNGEKCE